MTKNHHRHSIRLKGHDYAGGGLYFITICAHRDFKETCGSGATCGSPLLTYAKLIGDEWMWGGTLRDDVLPGEFVVMPDHFHGLIRLLPGRSELGHVIGAFKAAVSRRIRTGDTHVAPAIRIWQRNYYEMIVRSAEAESKITQYIQMNPWRCVQSFANGLRGMGNPTLWQLPKLGVLCSRNAPAPKFIPAAAVYFSGFHSPMEHQIMERLLEHKRSIIWCPAWGLDRAAGNPTVRQALEENRILILEMRNQTGDVAAAEARNRFVIRQSETLWTPHINPNGMLARLLKEARSTDD